MKTRTVRFILNGDVIGIEFVDYNGEVIQYNGSMFKYEQPAAIVHYIETWIRIGQLPK